MSSAAPRFGFTTPPEMAQPPRGVKSSEVSAKEYDAIFATPARKRLRDYASYPDAFLKIDSSHPRQRNDRHARYKAARLAGQSREAAGRAAGYSWTTRGSVEVCGLKLDLALGIPVKRKPRRASVPARLTLVLGAICAICGPGCLAPSPPPPLTPGESPGANLPANAPEVRTRIVITDPTWKDADIQLRIDAAKAIYAERGIRFTVTAITHSNRPELITVEDRDLPIMLRETMAAPDPVAVFCGAIYITADEPLAPGESPGAKYYGGIAYPLPGKLLCVAKVSCLDVLAHEYGHVLCQDHVTDDGNTMNSRTCKATSRFSPQQAQSMLACLHDKRRAAKRIEDLRPIVCKGRSK